MNREIRVWHCKHTDYYMVCTNPKSSKFRKVCDYREQCELFEEVSLDGAGGD